MELIQRRRGLIGAKDQSGSRLPKQYQEIEYIRSTGSQFINISDEYNQYEYSAVAAFMTTRTQYACLCGWSDDAYVSANIGYSGKMIVSRSNGRNTSKSASVTSADYIGQKLKFDCFKNYARISNPDTGVVLAENTDYFELIESPIWLFHCDSDKSYMLTRYVNAKLYAFKVYLSGSLIHDLVPCYRKSDNKPGLYDIISETFYTNQGNGDFTVGPDIN